MSVPQFKFIKTWINKFEAMGSTLNENKTQGFHGTGGANEMALHSYIPLPIPPRAQTWHPLIFLLTQKSGLDE